MLRRQLADEASGPIERVIRRAAQVLGLLTGELGVAIAPRLEISCCWMSGESSMDHPRVQ